MIIELTQEQVGIVMHALGQLPWHQANPVIVVIAQQAQAQQQSGDAAPA